MRLWHRRPCRPDGHEAEQALRHAESAAQEALRKRSRAQARAPMVSELADQLRGHREDNHLAEAVLALFRGRR